MTEAEKVLTIAMVKLLDETRVIKHQLATIEDRLTLLAKQQSSPNKS